MAEATETPSDEGSLLSRLLSPITDALDGIGRFLMLTAQTLVWMIRPPYRIMQLLGAMEFIGVQSIFIVSLTGVFSGMVLALQMTYSLRQYGAEGVVGAAGRHTNLLRTVLTHAIAVFATADSVVTPRVAAPATVGPGFVAVRGSVVTRW